MKPTCHLSVTAVFLFFLFSVSAQTVDTSFLNASEAAFAEVERICMNDNGRLWGSSLLCPLVIARRDDHSAVCSRDGLLEPSVPFLKVFCGNLGDTVSVAGTALKIKNTVCALLPSEYALNHDLLPAFIHEMFHVFQRNNGWEYNYDNSHLDNPDARAFLSCEMRALLNALAGDSIVRRRHLSEALFFRIQRNRLYPEKARDENLFEIHEGLADYTQYRLCLPSDDEMKTRIIRNLETTLEQEGYSRSYGYAVGAAYAFLNDVHPEWRLRIDTLSSLSMLTRRIYDVGRIVTDSAQIWEDYRVDSLLIVEDSVYQTKLKLKEDVYQAIGENRVLIFDYDGCHFGFNPNQVIGFGDGKNYYSLIEIRGDFGYVYTVYGCLLSDRIYMILPKKVKVGNRRAYPENFNIQLNKGWRVKNGRVVKK